MVTILKEAKTEDDRTEVVTKIHYTIYVEADDYGVVDYDTDDPRYYFDEFEFEKRGSDLEKELNDYELDIGKTEDDIVNFLYADFDDAKFTNESDSTTGKIDINVTIETNKVPDKSDLIYIGDVLGEMMEDDGNVLIEGTWSGEQEYASTPMADEPSYRSVSGEFDEICGIKLLSNKPTTYEIIK